MKYTFMTLFIAFAISFTANATTIAVIDSGVDYKHKDLVNNIWTNPENQTKDADGTVYNNDTHGWNFADKNNQVIDYKYLNTFSADCYKIFEVQAKILKGQATAEEKKWYTDKKNDQNFLKELQKFGNFIHGTHVSGISTHEAELSKVVALKLIPTETPGSNLDAKILELKALLSKHREANPLVKMMLGFLAKQQATLLTTTGKYTAAVKARVANGSFGTSVAAVKPVVKQLVQQFTGAEPSEADLNDYSIYFVQEIATACVEFVTSAPDTLFVFAAGNDGTNNDTLPTSPANIKADNSIAVAATLGTESLATFSNFGSKMVEVAAPGVAIMSTIPGDKTMQLSGTSMAAPFVTNVAGLIVDQNSRLAPKDVKKILMDTVDKKAFLNGKVTTGGIVNRARALRAAELSVNRSLEAAIAEARIEVADMPEVRSSINEKDLIVLPLPSLF